MCEQTLRNWHGKLAPEPDPTGNDASDEEFKAEIKRLRKELKKLLCNGVERTVDARWNLCVRILDQFANEECHNYFKHSDYRNDEIRSVLITSKPLMSDLPPVAFIVIFSVPSTMTSSNRRMIPDIDAIAASRITKSLKTISP